MDNGALSSCVYGTVGIILHIIIITNKNITIISAYYNYSRKAMVRYKINDERRMKYNHFGVLGTEVDRKCSLDIELLCPWGKFGVGNQSTQWVFWDIVWDG